MAGPSGHVHFTAAQQEKAWMPAAQTRLRAAFDAMRGQDRDNGLGLDRSGSYFRAKYKVFASRAERARPATINSEP
jgi:hypothetical protein